MDFLLINKLNLIKILVRKLLKFQVEKFAREQCFNRNLTKPNLTQIHLIFFKTIVQDVLIGCERAFVIV